MKSLEEIKKLHVSGSDQFSIDMMRAVNLMDNGSSIAIVVSAINGNDAFTGLYVEPRTK